MQQRDSHRSGQERSSQASAESACPTSANPLDTALDDPRMIGRPRGELGAYVRNSAE